MMDDDGRMGGLNWALLIGGPAATTNNRPNLCSAACAAPYDTVVALSSLTLSDTVSHCLTLSHTVALWQNGEQMYSVRRKQGRRGL